jgi:hypothetical protein
MEVWVNTGLCYIEGGAEVVLHVKYEGPRNEFDRVIDEYVRRFESQLKRGIAVPYEGDVKVRVLK